MTEKNSTRNEMPKLRISAIIVAILILAAATFWAFRTVGFKSITRDNILSLLGQLVLVAAFMERAVEFIISLWRETDKQLIVSDIQACKEKLSKAINDPTTENFQQELQTKEKELVMYKSQTQRIALWISFLFGLLISAVGVRSLEPLVKTSITTMAEPQRAIFYFTDMVLTGCIIAGGSDAIHEIANVYTNFMESTAKRAKKTGDS